MTGVVDSNFLYYMLCLNTEDVKPNLFEKLKKSGVSWCLSDIAFIESILHLKANNDYIKRILDLYKIHYLNMIHLFPDFNINIFLNEKENLKESHFDYILQFKLKKETKYLIDLFRLISITYKEYCIEKYKLDKYAPKIHCNFNSFWRANRTYLSKLLKEELEKLYLDDHFKLHRILRQHLFSVLFCIEWNLTAGIAGYDIGTLRDKMSDEGLVPAIPNKKELEAIINAINSGCEDENGNICDASSKMLNNKVFKDKLNSKSSLNGTAANKFKKEIVKRIFNDEACVMKNDFWDSRFLELGGNYYVLTYDTKFKNLIDIADNSMKRILDSNIEIIEGQKI